MKYPKEFSSQAKARVEAVRIAARGEFAETIKFSAYAPNLDESVDAYFRKVACAFAHEACEIGKTGKWDVDEVGKAVDRAAESIAFDTYTECLYLGFRSYQLIFIDTGNLRPEAWSRLKQSAEWELFQKELHDVAKIQSEVHERGPVSNLVSRAKLQIESAIFGGSPAESGHENVELNQPAKSQQPIAVSITQETIGQQIERLRRECVISIEELAEKVGLDPTNVSRHIHDESSPIPKNVRKYQEVFSNLLDRNIVIAQTQLNAAKRS